MVVRYLTVSIYSISLLNHGDVVLITGGSTNLELAKLLPKKMNLTFFTPSLPMAVELLNNSSMLNEVHLISHWWKFY